MNSKQQLGAINRHRCIKVKRYRFKWVISKRSLIAVTCAKGVKTSYRVLLSKSLHSAQNRGGDKAAVEREGGGKVGEGEKGIRLEWLVHPPSCRVLGYGTYTLICVPERTYMHACKRYNDCLTIIVSVFQVRVACFRILLCWFYGIPFFYFTTLNSNDLVQHTPFKSTLCILDS